jgi:exopolysaccharide biosynthesis operon protein EpsL
LAILVTSRAYSRVTRHALVSAAIFALAAVSIVRPAAADQADTINFTLNDTMRYDANVFRTPDYVGPQPGRTTKGDHINVMTAGFKVDKPYAQQRLQLDATKSITRYNTFSTLNSDALNYRGAWLWTLTPHLTGVLSIDRAQAQIPFTDISGTQRNVRTTENRNLTIDGWVSGGWHLLGGLGHAESSTEQTVLSTPSYQADRFEGGVRYVAASGNTISFTQRSIKSETINLQLDPVNLIETNYRDTESELKGTWKPSGNSSFSGTLTQKKRSNDHFSQRDFSGTAGELGYAWTPTGKLTFNLAARRTILPYAAYGNTVQNSTYQVNDTLSLGSVWQIDAKFTAHINLTRMHSDFLGPVFAVTAPARSDDYRSALIGLSWAPIRLLTLNASLQRDSRDSNNASFQYTDTIGMVSASVTF